MWVGCEPGVGGRRGCAARFSEAYLRSPMVPGAVRPGVAGVLCHRTPEQCLENPRGGSGGGWPPGRRNSLREEPTASGHTRRWKSFINIRLATSTNRSVPTHSSEEPHFSLFGIGSGGVGAESGGRAVRPIEDTAADSAAVARGHRRACPGGAMTEHPEQRLITIRPPSGSSWRGHDFGC